MFSELEKKLGYSFQNTGLLETALTHSSYAKERHSPAFNERLEFLGDSILGFVSAEYLYRNFPERAEGELTRVRAELVCEVNLAKVAARLDLGSFLLLGHGEELTGGRKRASLTADAVEAVIAAVYLDGGITAAADLVTRLILADVTFHEPKNEDFKTRLQELVQKKKDQTLQYRLIGESGPDHAKCFETEVLCNGVRLGTGTGSSKKNAEQAAARVAYEALTKNI